MVFWRRAARATKILKVGIEKRKTGLTLKFLERMENKE